MIASAFLVGVQPAYAKLEAIRSQSKLAMQYCQSCHRIIADLGSGTRIETFRRVIPTISTPSVT